MPETLKLKSPNPQALTARRLKITVVLDTAELLKVPAPDGQPRVVLRIALPDRMVKADLAAKSVRKAQAAIREAGVENIALLLQGHLIAGDVIAEAGLAAQLKALKPQTEAANTGESKRQPPPPAPPPLSVRQRDGFAELRAAAKKRGDRMVRVFDLTKPERSA